MQSRPPKLSADDPWKHDMFASQNNIEGGTLGARLAVPPKSLPTSNSGEIVGFQKALAAVNGRPVPSRGLSSKEESFNIRGASGVTVEVRELVQGTTAADVEAIFKRCGTVISSKLIPPPSGSQTETVHVKFQTQAAAEDAVSKFDNQPADGRLLKVSIISNPTISLKGAGAGNGGIVSVDALLGDSDEPRGSKMRSDAILATDARAQVITDPLAAATKAQAQRVAEQRGGRDGNWKEGRGRRGRGRGRRGRGAGRENGNGMEVD
ncbi:hypothetical protein SISSUDRAFT_1045738 [Sistotremastrum suecicum HHB10207 ss-3]|uniref:RRM domain-containing protein n=1 Tax=Sistotremastrum suecicum HHB10207 ss-3 TaxID=1314776 RepID=A0A166E7E0_9AGAM|nr:hypothetical protein SISSUDRAFT_1045738 [Sistotremastrum suecicum HHB10207 ss-3]